MEKENKTGFDEELDALEEAVRGQLKVLTEQLEADNEKLREYKKDHGDYYYREGAEEDPDPSGIQLVLQISRSRLDIKGAMDVVLSIIKVRKEGELGKDSNDNKKKEPFDPRKALKQKRKDL